MSSLGATFWIWGRVSALAHVFSPPRVTILRLENCPLITLLISKLMRLFPHFCTLSSHFAINFGQSSIVCPLVL
jgi:hypothetical protein